MNRILVVDDESDILELAKVMLESGGYRVDTATTGEEALRLIEGSRPDLVLLDVLLPGMSGLELLRRLRRGPGTRGIRVVLFTALGTEVRMMLSGDEVADGYLGKPFTQGQLLHLVGGLLRGAGGAL